jgi:UDPglucose 6-dehydrogenase
VDQPESGAPRGGEVIGVIGAGYVGLVVAACFARLGHRVVCLDIDVTRVARLLAGEVVVHEPGLAELLVDHADRIEFTSEPRVLHDSATILFVCVDTPPLASGDADLSHVEAAVDALHPEVDRPIVVMKSTVPVGTAARLRQRLDARALHHIAYVTNPEFLREGNAVADFLHPNRIVIGSTDDAAAARVAQLYASLDAEILHTDPASAEMIKLSSNAFLATKISFINEIANVCEEVGADVAVVARGMGLDPRIGAQFLRPGIGYGGSCFPKDVTALKQMAGNSGYHFQLLASVIEVNELQKRRVVGKLRARLGALAGRRIALLGLTFKPHTDDLREAPSLVLAARLVAEGATVVAYDPGAGDRAAELLPAGVSVLPSLSEAVAGADAAVVVTEWEEFRALLRPEHRDRMGRPLIIDGRNLFDAAEARAAGFEWEGVGRS